MGSKFNLGSIIKPNLPKSQVSIKNSTIIPKRSRNDSDSLESNSTNPLLA